MKKTLNFMAMALILLATACKDDEVRVPVLTVNPEELTIGREGGAVTFEVTSDSKWVVTNGAAWFSSDKTSGEGDATITVTVQASEQPTQRVDSIRLTSGTTLARVAIKQFAYYEDILGFVPDANLKTALAALLDTSNPKDGKVSTDEANVCKQLDLSSKQIASLDGLEYVPNLEVLNASNNAIETIDLAKTPNLTTLDCSGNQLAELDLSSVTSLTTLNCSGNELAALDFSNATGLTTLDCSDNELTALDLSPLTALTALDCSGNDWDGDRIDISANTSLVNLDLTGTGILYVNVSTGFVEANLTYQPDNLRFRNTESAFLSALPGVIRFAQDDASSSQIIAITSNVDWTITGAPGWVTLSATEGHDNASITVTINSTNDSQRERSANVTIAGDGKSTSVIVRQDALPIDALAIDKQRIDNASVAGTQTFELLTGRSYEIAIDRETQWNTEGEVIDNEWFSVSTTSGSGAADITVNFQENPYKYARLGSITITETDGGETTDQKVLLVRQEGNAIPQNDDDLFNYLPDPNLQNALLAVTSLAKTAEGKITVGTAKGYVSHVLIVLGREMQTALNLSGQNIQSLVGIELFESLTLVNFSNNSITSNNRNQFKVLDLSRNTSLIKMDAGNILELVAADVSNSTGLTDFTSSYSKLVELDFSSNPNLVNVQSNGGGTTTGNDDLGRLRRINLTNCPNLEGLQLACNLLKEIDLSQNSKIRTTIYLRKNLLTTVDFSALQSVATLNLDDNRLENVILPDRPAVTQDLTVSVKNSATYGEGKSFNDVRMLDASKCFGIYNVDVAGNANFTFLYIPDPHDNATVTLRNVENLNDGELVTDRIKLGPPPTAGQ
jgi:Leucine-rich repeat (LRR) protein